MPKTDVYISSRKIADLFRHGGKMMKAIAKPASVKGQMDMFELLDKLTEGEEAIEPPGAAEAEIGDMIRDVAAGDLPLDRGDLF